MKKYTESQLVENYNRFLEGLKRIFTGDRLDKLLFMYSTDELGPNLILSPASGNINFHATYDGGYIDHIMNVVKNSLKMAKMYTDMGGTLDFTNEELLFAAFHHDLGKLGIKDKLLYVKNDSVWHVQNKGEVYKRNPDMSFMGTTDRTIFLLNQYGLKFTENEYLGIKLTDGAYDTDNDKYLKSYGKKAPKIGYILHWADHMSTIFENEQQTK